LAGLASSWPGLPAFAQLKWNREEINSTPVPATDKGGRVIVLRGLYNIFSRGMDSMWKTLDELGIKATLDNHASWKRIADRVIEQYKTEENVAPIILIGHSLGADAALVMANWLGLNRVPVRLIVTFDGVAVTHPVMANVEEIINFYKPKGYGRKVEVVDKFPGTLNNIDLTKRTDIDHLNIDKDPVLQDEVIAEVLAILKVKPPKAKPAKAAPQDASNPQPAPKPKPKVVTNG
jgi:pimeloyl-ACP methyl ester carboxylesterase